MLSGVEVPGVVGEGEAIQEVFRLLHRVAKTSATLLARAVELLHVSRDALRYRIGKYRLIPS